MDHKTKHLKIVDDKTCFGMQEEHNVACQRHSCKNWISSEENINCSIIAAKHGPKTLRVIGELFGLSRMRICQIEKNIFNALLK